MQADDTTIKNNNSSETSESEDIKAAREMAWSWFTLHAQQRLTVFQSYLFIFGALFAGYGTLLQIGAEANAGFILLIGLIALLMTFLFFRLDRRNGELVKIGEDYLDVEQERLERTIRCPRGITHFQEEEGAIHPIRLVLRSNNELRSRLVMYSFSNVNIILFIGFALISLVGAGYGGYLLAMG